VGISGGFEISFRHGFALWAINQNCFCATAYLDVVLMPGKRLTSDRAFDDVDAFLNIEMMNGLPAELSCSIDISLIVINKNNVIGRSKPEARCGEAENLSLWFR
jgi:hypothetical protein